MLSGKKVMQQYRLMFSPWLLLGVLQDSIPMSCKSTAFLWVRAVPFLNGSYTQRLIHVPYINMSESSRLNSSRIISSTNFNAQFNNNMYVTLLSSTGVVYSCLGERGYQMLCLCSCSSWGWACQGPKHVGDSSVTYMLLLNCALKLVEEIILRVLKVSVLGTPDSWGR